MNRKVTDSKEYMLLCGERVKKCREDAGFTQDQLIENIQNLPENKGKERNVKHLSAIECGRRSLSIEYARLISRILRVKEEYLLGYSEHKNDSEENHEQTLKLLEKHSCIKYLLNSMGYREDYASEIRYQKLYISSEDSEQTIKSKIDFAKKGLSVMPERDMTITDQQNRKIHITSSEITRIYDDIEYFIKCRIEQEFNDITRYKHYKDMKLEKSPNTNQ